MLNRGQGALALLVFFQWCKISSIHSIRLAPKQSKPDHDRRNSGGEVQLPPHEAGTTRPRVTPSTIPLAHILKVSIGKLQQRQVLSSVTGTTCLRQRLAFTVGGSDAQKFWGSGGQAR